MSWFCGDAKWANKNLSHALNFIIIIIIIITV